MVFFGTCSVYSTQPKNPHIDPEALTLLAKRQMAESLIGWLGSFMTIICAFDATGLRGEGRWFSIDWA